MSDLQQRIKDVIETLRFLTLCLPLSTRLLAS